MSDRTTAVWYYSERFLFLPWQTTFKCESCQQISTIKLDPDKNSWCRCPSCGSSCTLAAPEVRS